MKRLALAALLALSLPAYAQTWTPGVGLTDGNQNSLVQTGVRYNSFTCGLAGLAATLTECQALAAGRTYYVTDIVVGTTTATSGTYGIQTGTGTNCAAGTVTIFPAPPATTASRYQAPIAANPVAVINFTTPLVTTAGHAICVIGVGTNTINIQISGYYLP